MYTIIFKKLSDLFLWATHCYRISNCVILLYVQDVTGNSVTNNLILNPLHYLQPALLEKNQRDLFDRQYDPTSSWYLSVVERKCGKTQIIKRKHPLGKPNDARERPVKEQKELMFVLVTVGIPHWCGAFSHLLLVCIL